MTRLGWLRHAFAVDTTQGEAVCAQTSALLDLLVHEVKRRRLEVPALMFLEMSRPLNRLSAATLSFFQPLASCLFSSRDLSLWVAYLERSDAIDGLILRLERGADARRHEESSLVDAASAERLV